MLTSVISSPCGVSRLWLPSKWKCAIRGCKVTIYCVTKVHCTILFNIPQVMLMVQYIDKHIE